MDYKITPIAPGTYNLGGIATLTVTGEAPAPVPPPPAPAPAPAPSGDTSFNGLTRMTLGAANWPTKPRNNYYGALTSMDTVLHGTWGMYFAATGQPLNFNIPAGQYVSLAFTPSDAGHVLQWAYNQTFGQNGLFWLSDSPGGHPINGAAVSDSSTSLTIYPIPGYAGSVVVGKQYFINLGVAANSTDGRPVSYSTY